MDVSYKMSDALTGKMVLRYHLDKKLGSGVFGSVYKCTDVLTREVRAIKLLEKNNRENQSNFTNEVASHQILSEYPDCNAYVLCMYGFGTYYSRSYENNLNRVRAIQAAGKTVQDELNQLEAIPLKNSSYIKTTIATTKTILRDRIEEILLAKEELGLQDSKPVVGDYLFIVTELMDDDLTGIMDLIHKDKITYSIRVIDFIIGTLVEGLKYIHDSGLTHADIKPENILWKIEESDGAPITIEQCLQDPALAEEYLRIVYGDLGFTCIDDADRDSYEEKIRSCDSEKGTPIYLSPELATRSYRGNVSLAEAHAADVWALAVTLWKLVWGDEPPYLEGLETYEDLVKKLRSLRPDFISEYIEEGKLPLDIEILFKGMFILDPEDRVTIDEIYEFLEESKARKATEGNIEIGET